MTCVDVWNPHPLLSVVTKDEDRYGGAKIVETSADQRGDPWSWLDWLRSANVWMRMASRGLSAADWKSTLLPRRYSVDGVDCRLRFWYSERTDNAALHESIQLSLLAWSVVCKQLMAGAEAQFVVQRYLNKWVRPDKCRPMYVARFKILSWWYAVDCSNKSYGHRWIRYLLVLNCYVWLSCYGASLIGFNSIPYVNHPFTHSPIGYVINLMFNVIDSWQWQRMSSWIRCNVCSHISLLCSRSPPCNLWYCINQLF